MPLTTRLTQSRTQPSNHSQDRKISLEHENLMLVYEYHKDADGSSNFTRLHVSKRGALGPPPTQPTTTATAAATGGGVNNQQQQQHNPQANTVVINNDHGGVTIDISSTKNDNESFNIIITNSGN
ncbi:unnamed protein product [Adineta steineri]|uniref:Uncharacterized protein n=2 Tax=Adineta steineri TaxID=433720 RepID=A0A815SAM9_9BILA|nr:unnamed protein product [Adineta steineri]